MKFTYTLAITALSFSLAACASMKASPDSEIVLALDGNDERIGDLVQNVCFLQGVNDVTPVSKKSAVISVGQDNDYIISFVGNCTALSETRHVGFKTRTNCLKPKDDLLVSRVRSFRPDGNYLPPQSCRIDRINKWEAKAAPQTPDVTL